MNREAIYSALLELVGSIPGVVTKERVIRHWDNVAATDCPYIAVTQHTEQATQEYGMPVNWILNPEVFIYVEVGNDPNENPYTLINPIIDAICELFNPDNYPGENQTLGGLVGSVTLNGGVELSGGVLGTKAMAVIPLQIVVNN